MSDLPVGARPMPGVERRPPTPPSVVRNTAPVEELLSPFRPLYTPVEPRGRASGGSAGGLSQEELARQLGLIAPEEVEDDPLPFIGMEDGTPIATRRVPQYDPMRDAVTGALVDQEVEPRYVQGDEWRPASKPPEEVARMQRALVDAGVLVGSFALGVWDETSAAAYRRVLGHANRAGLTDNQALAAFARAKARGAPKAIFQAPAYLKPSVDTLKQAVRRAFGDREPTERELAMFTEQLAQDFRAAYDQKVAQLRDEFEAGQTGLEGMNEAEMIVAQADGAEPVQDRGGRVYENVSPAESFLERLNAHRAAERATKEKHETSADNRETLQTGFAAIRRAIGG